MGTADKSNDDGKEADGEPKIVTPCEARSDAPKDSKDASDKKEDIPNYRERFIYAPLAAAIRYSDTHGGAISAIATVCIAIATIVNVVYVGGQLAEMKSGSTQTDKLITSNADLAKAAKDQAAAATGQIKVMRDQLQEMRDAENDSKILIKANVSLATAAQQSADIANKNLVATQRAWVGPTDATLIKSQDETLIKGTVSYVNSGREPAKMNGDGTEYIYSRDDWNSGRASVSIEERQNACLAANKIDGARFAWPTTGFNSYLIHFPEGQIPQNGVLVWTKDIDDGSSIVALQGCILYEAFSQLHHTAFCYFYDSKTSDIAHLSICNTGNYTN